LLHERAEEAWIVKHRIDPLFAQHRFGVVGTTGAGAREEMHRQLRIITRERFANVRENHDSPTQTESFLFYASTPNVPGSAHGGVPFV
jgi:hypothetical protein